MIVSFQGSLLFLSIKDCVLINSSCLLFSCSSICICSTVQDGFELPTRLSVAAADCILDLTKALTRKTSITDVSSRRSKSSNSDVSNLPTTLVPAAVGEKKVKPTSKSAEFSNKLEMELLLWDHIDKLIILVQRLLAVCSNLCSIYLLPCLEFWCYYVLYLPWNLRGSI